MAKTEPTTSGPQVGSDDRRIVGIDMARALALFGMMATHLLPDSVDGRTVAWWQQVAGGRAAALFALLAGVSLALITARAASTPADADPTQAESTGAGPEETPDRTTEATPERTPDGTQRPSRRTALRAARAGILVRAAVIAVLGLFLGQLDTGIAVILTYYGVLFVFGLPFLGLGWRTLAALAAGWAVVSPVLSHLVREHLPERLGPSPSLDFLLQYPLRLVTELVFTGYYPTFQWLAYLLAGMAIGRLPLRRISVAVGLTVTGVVLAFAAWGTSWLILHRLDGLAHLRATAPDSSPFDLMPVDQALVRGTFGTTPTTSWWWLTTAAPHSSTTFDLFQTIGSAMVVVGLCLLVCQAVPRVLRVVFAAGAMTLTLYTLHLVALDLEVGPPRDTVELYVLHVLGATAFAMLCITAVGRGPLESFTRSCSQVARDSVLLVSRERGREDVSRRPG
ncbi:MAG TPA: heparan-alpha-glucosaminide N-acetyltransferase domain-containing protein [Nocardioidaceae bacterium]|nr:heparan-alpha-glucosaminide N-acetyltransferase domain-containing protein [Nocardioidaceae bacterium]